MSARTLDFDRSVPILIVKIGRYPLHHGSVGAVRTLGRVGVPVYAVTEDRFTPVALSRYLSGRFVWPTSGLENPIQLVEALAGIGCRLERRAIALPTDDEAAVLLAEHGAELADWFIVPDTAPGLPGALASKRGAHELCRTHGVPTLKTVFPSGKDELLACAEEATFPVVVKNVEPWVRLAAPLVPGTTVVSSARELRWLAEHYDEGASAMVQEYLPREDAEDWIFHVYLGVTCTVPFTAVKLRSWPPHMGVTTHARAAANQELADLSVDFCRRIGFRGIADLDWRFDRRDGRYKLLDFNPRLGAQFRLFETHAGIDVVRALHLDLTGRRVPASPQIEGRGLVVENLDLPAMLAYRKTPGSRPSVQFHKGRTELAWLSLDDPLPFLMMSIRFALSTLARIIGLDRRSRK